MSFFDGFSSMRALTYTPSIPMVLELLKDFDYERFECIFGHNGILNRDAADILAFQSIVDEKLNKGFVGVKGLSDSLWRSSNHSHTTLSSLRLQGVAAY